MIDLAVPFHPARTGGLLPQAYLERLAAMGATAVELQLPNELLPGSLEPLDRLLPVIHELGLRCHMHAPARLASPATPSAMQQHGGWAAVSALAERAAALQGSPVQLVLHPADVQHERAAAPCQESVCFTQRLLALAPHIHPMLELLSARPQQSMPARIRRWWQARRVQPRLPAPPLATRIPAPGEDDQVDPCVVPRGAAASSRELLLATVERIGDARAGICWDLGHDWRQSCQHGPAGWAAMPGPRFLQAVRHVHLHDGLPNGALHLPLQTGHVPYATQLRALLRAGFPGVVTLEIFFGREALRLGERFTSLQRSLAIARQTLRLQPAAPPAQASSGDRHPAPAER